MVTLYNVNPIMNVRTACAWKTISRRINGKIDMTILDYNVNVHIIEVQITLYLHVHLKTYVEVVVRT